VCSGGALISQDVQSRPYGFRSFPDGYDLMYRAIPRIIIPMIAHPSENVHGNGSCAKRLTFLWIAKILWMSALLSLGLESSSSGQLRYRGADISSLDQLEQYGAVYKENGTPRELIGLLADHGINCIRLRLWHSPPGGINNLASTIRIARRAKQLGLSVLLDFHFSDTWADPGQQAKPAAWSGISFTALRDSVRLYVRDVIAAMRLQNALPDIVQFGNEITCGMLWDDGRICDPFNIAQQWHNLGALLQSSRLGLSQALQPGDSVLVAMHIDRGGDSTACAWFFDHLRAEGIPFDIIALSYYPLWQGSMEGLAANLRFVAQRYAMPIILAETAYPWTLAWADSVPNLIGLQSQLLPAYPATVAGQRSFLIDLMSLVEATPGGRGLGVFYWAPEYISVPPLGSVWENVTLFDFSGELLNSIQAFEQQSGVKAVRDQPANIFLLQNFPNPFNPRAIIRFSIPGKMFVTLSVYDVLGRQVAQLLHDVQQSGPHEVVFNGEKLSSGVYYCRLEAGGVTTSTTLILLR
jgi:arabinogalactan endo-1,4-beta-galactosidase